MEVTREEIFITTNDNPFNPFDQFDDWFRFDCDKKYFTCSYIDRVVQSFDEKRPSTKASEEDFDRAMKEIVEYNPYLYKVVRHTYKADTIYDVL